VEWLGQKENPERKGWASGEGYGGKICRVLQEMKNQKKERRRGVCLGKNRSLSSINFLWTG